MTNRNLPSLLVQILYVVAIFAVLAVLALIFIAMLAGSLAGLKEAAADPENLFNLLKSSIGLILVGVIFLVVFFLIAMLLNAAAQSGIIGCLIQTARGEVSGFSMSAFIASFRASTMSFFRLQILIMLIVSGVGLALVVIGIAAFGLVLLPLKESGSPLTAFAVGVPLLVVLILSALVFVFLMYSGGVLSQVSLVSGARGAFSSIGDAYDFIRSRFWDAMLFTLLVIFLAFGASMMIELMTMPFKLFGSGDNAVRLLWLVPVLFVANIIKLYVGLFALSCFVVYYVSGTAPAVPGTAGPGSLPLSGQDGEILDAEIVEPAHREGEGGPSDIYADMPPGEGAGGDVPEQEVRESSAGGGDADETSPPETPDRTA